MEATTEHTAKVLGRDLSISTKHAIVIAKVIRGKTVQGSKQFLQRVLNKEQAVPFTRFKKDMGHKPGHIAAGRYPQKATKAVIGLLNAVEANAQNKGLDTDNLIIKTIITNRASRPYRMGRRRRIQAKRTHIEIIVEETEEKKATKQKQQEKKLEVAEQKAKQEATKETKSKAQPEKEKKQQ